ncbi:MAG: hypothetical protein ACRDHE_10850 [Ktedonobacterales bacterium]
MTRLEHRENDVERVTQSADSVRERLVDGLDKLNDRLRDAGAKTIETLHDRAVPIAASGLVEIEMALTTHVGQLPPEIVPPVRVETAVAQPEHTILKATTPEAVTESQRDMATEEIEREGKMRDDAVEGLGELAKDIAGEQEWRRQSGLAEVARNDQVDVRDR